MPTQRWTQVDVCGHPVDVFQPAQRREGGGVLIYLHGVHLSRLIENETFSRLFDQHGLAVAAPMTGPSWWTDRICPAFDAQLSAERHVVQNVLPWIGDNLQAAPPRVALLGTSMGGQGALRLAFKYPQLFSAAAGIAPAVDFHLRLREEDDNLAAMYAGEEAARQDTATLHVHALNWPRHIYFCCDPLDHRWHDGAEKLRMKLYSLGIPHECDLDTSAGGHGWEYYNHKAAEAVGFVTRAI